MRRALPPRAVARKAREATGDAVAAGQSITGRAGHQRSPTCSAFLPRGLLRLRVDGISVRSGRGHIFRPKRLFLIDGA